MSTPACSSATAQLYLLFLSRYSRHTTGSHLLQSGVDISIIALWLGHEGIQTTHVYIEADLATKQRALEKLEPLGANARRFKPRDEVLAFLSSL